MLLYFKKTAAAAALVMALVFCALLANSAPETAPAAKTVEALDDHPAAQLAMSSGLPVLSITTPDGILPDEDDMAAELVVFEQNGENLSTRSTAIEINVRGNTSRRFPKKSYRVKIVNARGEKSNMSFAGLRSDDDWLLNPMYTDTSKIREALAYDVWEEINSSAAPAASSRLEYAEVFINGEYWGLYGIQERIDRKQVDGDKQSGILYKVVANDRPTVDELLSCTSREVCKAFQLEFAGSSILKPWEPAAAYIAYLNGENPPAQAGLSQENLIDYGLWAMATQAHDCHFKNQFLNCVYSADGHTMYKIPWDLNNTFGDVWRDASPETNHTQYQVGGSLVMDGAFRVLVESGDPDILTAIQNRWKELRKGAITEEWLLARAQALYLPLIDVIDRDSERWPSCGMGNGNARNIRDIEGYIRDILPRMDEYIANLGAEE